MGDVGEYPRGIYGDGLDEARKRFNRAMDRADAVMARFYRQEAEWRDLFASPQWTADEIARFDTESGVKFQFSGHVTSRGDEPAIGPAFRSLMASIRDKVTSRITSPDDATECEIPYMDLLSLVAEQECEIAALKAQVLALTPKPEPVRNPMANALRFGAQNTGLRGL